MRVILLILAIAAIAYLVLRMSHARNSGNSTLGAPRRLSNTQKRVTAQLSTIEDPRIAATAMMVATAEHDGAITEQEETIIVEQAMAQFEIDEATSLKLLRNVQTMVRKVDDLDHCFQTLAPVISRNCTPDECNELLEMLAAIALQSSDTTAVPISNAIANLRDELVRA